MSDRPISVLHLVADLGQGGAEKQLYLLCRNASAGVRHQVLAVCAEGRWTENLRAAGIAVDCLGAKRTTSVKALVGVVRFLRYSRPDVLHSWLPSMNVLGAAAKWLARQRKMPMIASVRNVDDWKPAWRRILESVASRAWDLVVCNSWAGREQCLREGIDENKLQVVLNGIPPRPKIWDRREARRRLGLTDSAFVVACASRLVPQKRVECVLAAARVLPLMQFVIAGEGSSYEGLRSGAPDNARFLGSIVDTGVLFAAADVFVSTSEREGTSNSLLEALQCGCAAAVTAVGDNLQIAGGAGMVVTPATLAAALERLLNDAHVLGRMRAEAPERARLYSVDSMVAGTERLYESLAGMRQLACKKVLYLDYTNGIGMGGGQRSLLLLLAHLDRSRFQPMLACPPDERWREFVPSDVRVVDLPLPDAFRCLSRFSAGWFASFAGAASAVGAALELRRLLVRDRVDVVHANNFKMLLLAALATVGRGIPILWHVRDILPPRRIARWTHALGARLATRVLTVSSAVARQFHASTELVHNAVNLPDLGALADDRRRFRHRHAIPDDAFVFGYIGRLDAGKGIDILLRAFARVGARRPGIWLVISGAGPECTPLAQLGEGLGIERLRWTGFENSPGYTFAGIDCAVVPSVEPDSFPRAVIEAMSWSRAVIGSTSGGIAEAIVAGETGSVVPAGDVEALEHEMEKLADNRAIARAMGLAGRRVCEEKFAVANQMTRIEALYQEVLAEAR